MYYSYHNRIQQKISSRLLERFEFVSNHKLSSGEILPKALLLYFTGEPKPMPVREKRFKEYQEILNQL